MTVRKRRPKDWAKLPDLPKYVYSALGLVEVRVVKDLADEDHHLLGQWLSDSRIIQIRDGMHPSTMHQVLGHEWCHMVLNDAGVQLSKEQEEAVCDAIGSARAAEVLARAKGELS